MRPTAKSFPNPIVRKNQRVGQKNKGTQARVENQLHVVVNRLPHAVPVDQPQNGGSPQIHLATQEALRWSDCNFVSMSFSVQHSYYWRRGGHLKTTKTEASPKVLPMHLALKDALLEWKSQSEYDGPGGFVFPSYRHKGKKPMDLAAVLKRKDPACIYEGWHSWRRLAHVSAFGQGDAGREGRTSTHDPRLFASQQSPCDEQISLSNTGKQRLAERKLVDAILPGGLLSVNKSTLIQELVLESAFLDSFRGTGGARTTSGLIGPKRTQIFFWALRK
jgi:hypothetical protein